MTADGSRAGSPPEKVGGSFEDRVVAWYLAATLAEEEISAQLGFDTNVALKWIRCQTGEAVDDFLINTSAGGFIFGQVKHSLNLSKSEKSPLGKTVDQFVRQFIKSRDEPDRPNPWSRPLDPGKDKLVAVGGRRTSSKIWIDLPNLLAHVRGLVEGQPLETAAENENERAVLSVLQEHVSRCWQQVAGKNATTEELRQFLSLVHVQRLDVDEGGNEELFAIEKLKHFVLRNPRKARAAWLTLISVASKLATKRVGADCLSLQRELVDIGIEPLAASSYRNDIEILKRSSAQFLDLLSDYSSIKCESKSLRIDRPCSEALWKTLKRQSILAIGDPGAGKSGVLHEIGSRAISKEYDLLLLLVDRIDARSLLELRNELGVKHEIADILNNWPGCKPAFLIIDALDAARGETAMQVYRDLIRVTARQGSRWRILASIRKFDLRYSGELQEMFSGTPVTGFSDPEFSGIQHISIKALSDSELADLLDQSSLLVRLHSVAPKPLENLLKNLFNLRLAAELLSTGIRQSEIAPIQTQLGLLERYWLHRVLMHPQTADDRENVLRIICLKMVEDRKLRIPRGSVQAQGAGPILRDLLSAHVIAEWQLSPAEKPHREVLCFSHNVLFDYAVARLLLRGPLEVALDLLSDDGDFCLLAKPSIDMHFQYLWADYRSDFWEATQELMENEDVTTLAKVIPPTVAAAQTKNISDLTPLLNNLVSQNEVIRSTAESILENSIASLLTFGVEKVSGPGAGPWCQFAERVSSHLSQRTAYPIAALLRVFLQNFEHATRGQIKAAGAAARHLVQFGWETNLGNYLISTGLKAVCRTISSNKIETTRIITRALEHQHLETSGYFELPIIAGEIDSIAASRPGLATRIYSRAFEFEESSRTQTPIGNSRILPMTSNRAQDYEMARWELAEKYPAFLAMASSEATLALIKAVEFCSERESGEARRKPRSKTFDFLGRKARYRSDYSCIWDSGDLHAHDDHIRMLDEFERFVKERATYRFRSNRKILEEILDVLAKHARNAVIWRRLLRAATADENASTGVGFARYIAPLAAAQPILCGSDTRDVIGEYLRVYFSKFNRKMRLQIENEILAIPRQKGQKPLSAAQSRMAQLLGCLDRDSIVGTATRTRLDELLASNQVPKNEPPFRFETSWTPVTEEERLRELGVKIDEEPNRYILSRMHAVQKFNDAFLNATPTFQAAQEIWDPLKELYSIVGGAEPSLDPDLEDRVWNCLARASARIARMSEFDCSDELGIFVTRTLVAATGNRKPAYSENENINFDEFGSFGDPAARLHSAEGLLTLAPKKNCEIQKILPRIEALSSDGVHAVRYEVAIHLINLFNDFPEVVWQIIEDRANLDPSSRVLLGLMQGTIGHLALEYPDRTLGYIMTMLNRMHPNGGENQFARAAYSIIEELYLYGNHLGSKQFMFEIIRNLHDFSNGVYLIYPLRTALVYGDSTPEHKEIRARAFLLTQQLLNGAADAIGRMLSENRPREFEVWIDKDKTRWLGLQAIIQEIANTVYFASGAHDMSKDTRIGQLAEIPEKSKRFYDEADGLLDDLAAVVFPGAAHRVVEMLEPFAQIDPARIFLLIEKVVNASSKKAAYNYESLAVDLIVRIVEQYLADYREQLLEDKGCRNALVNVLNMFIEAGWPSARRIAYRLEEIFR